MLIRLKLFTISKSFCPSLRSGPQALSSQPLAVTNAVKYGVFILSPKQDRAAAPPSHPPDPPDHLLKGLFHSKTEPTCFANCRTVGCPRKLEQTAVYVRRLLRNHGWGTGACPLQTLTSSPSRPNCINSFLKNLKSINGFLAPDNTHSQTKAWLRMAIQCAIKLMHDARVLDRLCREEL